jgi:hypothetical protein
MAVPDRIEVGIADASGDLGSTAAFVPATFTLAQLNEASPVIATNVDSLLYGKVVSIAIKREADVSGLTNNTAAVASDVSNIGAFEFVSAEGNPVKLRVPAFDEGLVAAGSDDIDQSAPSVAALLAMMTNGISVTGGTIIPCDRFEDDIVAVVLSAERHKKRGKRG